MYVFLILYEVMYIVFVQITRSALLYCAYFYLVIRKCNEKSIHHFIFKE